MRFLTAEVFLSFVFFIDHIQSELHPDVKNVCLTLENYEETGMVNDQKGKSEKRWCWKTECRSKTNVLFSKGSLVLTKENIIPKCCEGFIDIGMNCCVPHCPRGCNHGRCILPNVCMCDPGYTGPRCDEVCPRGRWGADCSNKCACTEKEKCHAVTGCKCKPGWRGDKCHLPCQEGYYGYSCEKKCNCDLGCNHETGACITTAVTSHPNSRVSESATEESTDVVSQSERNEISEMTQLHEILATEANTESFSLSERALNEIWASSEKTTEKESGFSEVSEPIGGVSEATENVELSSNRISESTEKEASQRAYSEEPVSEKKVKFLVQNGINFLGDLETFSKSTDTEETELNVGRRNMDAHHVTDDESFLIKATDHPEKADKNETDNLINSGKGSSLKDDSQSKFHFLASLSIISGISLIIFVTAAKWLIVSHRNRVKKKLTATTQKEKILQGIQIKPQGQKLFLANNFMDNPKYLSDVDINKPVPILQTFKPVTTNN